MFPTPRFVSLVDAAEGDFDKWIEAPSLPAPLSPSEAPHLHSYVQSFLTEVFDWSACEAQGPQGYVRPDHLLDVDAVPVQDSTRSDCWTVRIQAILKTGSEATTVLGGSRSGPQLSARLCRGRADACRIRRQPHAKSAPIIRMDLPHAFTKVPSRTMGHRRIGIGSGHRLASGLAGAGRRL